MTPVVKNAWPRASLVTCVIVSLVAIGAVSAASLAAQDPIRSTNEGVYTSRQASRGARVFEDNCTACHDTARFRGSIFLENWTGQPLFNIFDLMRYTMPEDNPGSLKPQDYADVLSFFLSLNGFPDGETQLEGTEAAMQAVQIQPPPSTAPDSGY